MHRLRVRRNRASPAKESATSEPPPSVFHRLTWLLPALTFVVGVVLGAVVVAAVTSGGDAGTAADGSAAGAGGTPGATGTPSPSTPPDTTVTVPGECAALADDAKNAAGLLEQAATAARDLDAKTLADVVRRMQDARDHLMAQAAACRGAAPSASVSSS